MDLLRILGIRTARKKAAILTARLDRIWVRGCNTTPGFLTLDTVLKTYDWQRDREKTEGAG